MDEDLAATVRMLADRQAIMDCLLRYTRGVDRLDRELMLSAYHADAIDDHGLVVLVAADFVDWAIDYHRTHNVNHHHMISNVTIDLAGDVAHVESYYTFIGINPTPPDNLSFGRYVDRVEKRDGRWAIAARYCFSESVNTLTTADLGETYRTLLMGNGPQTRDRNDASYQRPLVLDRAGRAALREGVPEHAL